MKTLTLVVPCHNESLRIDKRAFVRAVEKWPWISFCFVDDGSTDMTAETLAHMTNISPAFHAIYLPDNKGKAEAVRAGIRYLCQNTGPDFIGFWDADLAAPLDEVPGFMRHFEEFPGTEAVIGSRWPHLGSDITRTHGRGLASFIAKSIIRLALGANVWDTQCGAKIFSRKAADDLFRQPFKTRWLFDVELLSRLGGRIGSSVREHPLASWSDIPGSKVGFATLRELVSLPFLIRANLVEYRKKAIDAHSDHRRRPQDG